MKDNVLLPVTSLQTTIYAQAVTQNYHGLTIPTQRIRNELYFLHKLDKW